MCHGYSARLSDEERADATTKQSKSWDEGMDDVKKGMGDVKEGVKKGMEKVKEGTRKGIEKIKQDEKEKSFPQYA